MTPVTGPLAGYGGAGATAVRLWADRGVADDVARLSVHDTYPDPVAGLRAAQSERPDVLLGPYAVLAAVVQAAPDLRRVAVLDTGAEVQVVSGSFE